MAKESVNILKDKIDIAGCPSRTRIFCTICSG